MKRFILLTAVLLFAASWSHAGSVTTKDGTVIHGEVIIRDDTVTIKSDKGLYQFKLDDLAAVDADGEAVKEEPAGDEGEKEEMGFTDLLEKVRETEEALIVGEDENPLAAVITEKGVVFIELYEDKAPNTVANFIHLAEDGFYDELTFHRVEPGFVVQGGDPAGNGSGGPGYRIKAEISDLRHGAGAAAMARLPDHINPGRDSSGSQYYICLEPAHFLDNQYTIFGQTVEGMDTVKKIAVGDKMKVLILKKRDREYKPEIIEE